MRKVYEEDDESDGNEGNDVFADNDVNDVDDRDNVDNSHKNTNTPDERTDDEVDRLWGKDKVNEDTTPFEMEVVYSPIDRKKVGARVTKTSDCMCIEMEQQQPQSCYVWTLFMHIPTKDIGVKQFEVIKCEIDCEGSRAAEKLHVRFSNIQDAIDYVRSRGSGIVTASVDNVSHVDFSTSATLNGKWKQRHAQIDQQDVKVADTTVSGGSAGKMQGRNSQEQRMMSGRWNLLRR